LADADLLTWHLDVVKNMIAKEDKEYAAWLRLRPTPTIKVNYNKHVQDKAQYFIVRPDEMKLTFFNLFQGFLKKNPRNRSPVACMANTKTDTYMFLNLAIKAKPHLKDCLNEIMRCRVWYQEGATLPTVVMINGDTSATPEMQQVLTNPNAQLAKCEAFIANSAISTAIDIQLLRFKFMFAVQGQGQAADSDDFTQLLQQIRHKNHVWIGLTGAHNFDLPLSLSEIQDNMLHLRDQYSDIYQYQQD
jgi:hypothetical protein